MLAAARDRMRALGWRLRYRVRVRTRLRKARRRLRALTRRTRAGNDSARPPTVDQIDWTGVEIDPEPWTRLTAPWAGDEPGL